MDETTLIFNIETYNEIHEKLWQGVLKKTKAHIIERFSWILPEEADEIFRSSSVPPEKRQAKLNENQRIIEEGEWKERIEFTYTSFSIFSYPIEGVPYLGGANEQSPTLSGRIGYRIPIRKLEGYVSFSFNLGITLTQEMGLSLCIFPSRDNNFNFQRIPEIEDLNQSIINTFINNRLSPPSDRQGISFWFSREADFKMLNALTGFNMLQALTQAKRACKREVEKIDPSTFTGKDKERSKARIDYYHFKELAPGLIEELCKTIKEAKKDLSKINFHKIIFNFCEKEVSKVYKKHKLGV